MSDAAVLFCKEPHDDAPTFLNLLFWIEEFVGVPCPLGSSRSVSLSGGFCQLSSCPFVCLSSGGGDEPGMSLGTSLG